jgi:hypothetical protein
MELSAAQRHFDTIQKLKPTGKFGGLGRGGAAVARTGGKRDDGLPENMLYVRRGGREEERPSRPPAAEAGCRGG